MSIVIPDSLALTVDNVNEVFFFSRPLRQGQRIEAARWIALRQGLPGSYAGMPAPTEKDLADGVRVFTGEKVGSRAGAQHILGEEACRALCLLSVDIAEIAGALQTASEGMVKRLAASRAREENAGRTWAGRYCCARCTVAAWRQMTAGGLREADPGAWLLAGLQMLQRRQMRDGGWRGFPFHYTLLALTEIDLPEARAQLRHAAQRCERLVERSAEEEDPFVRRRREVGARALSKL